MNAGDKKTPTKHHATEKRRKKDTQRSEKEVVARL